MLFFNVRHTGRTFKHYFDDYIEKTLYKPLNHNELPVPSQSIFCSAFLPSPPVLQVGMFVHLLNVQPELMFTLGA